MTGRELFELYRNAHGAETGSRPADGFDSLSIKQQFVWTRLADDVVDEVQNDLRERGIIWEPTS
jgi:hypothetical protein